MSTPMIKINYQSSIKIISLSKINYQLSIKVLQKNYIVDNLNIYKILQGWFHSVKNLF